jgi:hypothetical protein
MRQLVVDYFKKDRCFCLEKLRDNSVITAQKQVEYTCQSLSVRQIYATIRDKFTPSICTLAE